MHSIILPPPPSTTTENTMTLRDHLASQALNGLLASSEANSAVWANNPALNGHDHLAKTAYRLADAMLTARKQAVR
jgi:hypothetical protein